MSDLLTTFQAVTGADSFTAQFYLDMTNWDLEQATSAFFDQGGKPATNPAATRPAVKSGSQKKTVSFKPDAYARGLRETVKNLYKNPLLSDVTLIVNEEERVPAHKLVITSWSDVLADLLAGKKTIQAGDDDDDSGMQLEEKEKQTEMEEERGPVVRIQSDPRTNTSHFLALLKFMYNGSYEDIDSETALPLTIIAHQFNVSKYKEQCAAFLFHQDKQLLGLSRLPQDAKAKKRLLSDKGKDVSRLLEIATTYHCQLLESLCASYLALHFKTLVQSGQAFDLPPSTWCELLKSDDIAVAENVVFKAVMDYSQHQRFERADLVLERLLPQVRLPLLSTSDLESQVCNNPVLQTIPIIHDLLHEAYRYKLYPSATTRTSRCVPRVGDVRWSSKSKSVNITLSNEDKTAKYNSLSANVWACVSVKEWLTTGVHTFRFKINHNASSWLFIGVVAKTFTGFSSTYVGATTDSWGFCNASGWGKATAGSNTPFGRHYTTGDIVTMEVDMDKHTVSYAVNNDKLAVAWSSLPAGPLLPTISLYQTGDSMTLLPPE